jgi:hypothetical protein
MKGMRRAVAGILQRMGGVHPPTLTRSPMQLQYDDVDVDGDEAADDVSYEEREWGEGDDDDESE